MKISSFKNSDMDFGKLDGKNPYFHIMEAIKKIYPEMAGLKILDIGCGREKKYQILAYALAKEGCDVTGVDIECRNEVIRKNLRFVKSAAENIDKKFKEKFDVVVSAYFFGYVTRDWSTGNGKKVKEYETEIMKKVHDILKEGGTAVSYMNEMWSLDRKDLASMGFEIIKFPKQNSTRHLEDGLCVLKKSI